MAWAAWSADGTPGGLMRLRTTLLAQLERLGERLAVGTLRDDAGWQQRHDAAAAASRRVVGRDQHVVLRAIAAGDPNAVAALPRVDDRVLAQVMGRLLTGGGQDVAEDELREALEHAGHTRQVPGSAVFSPGGARGGQASGEWECFPLVDGWAALHAAVRTAPDHALRRVVELVTATSGALELIMARLGPAALAGHPAQLPGLAVEVAPDAMLTALNDPMWELWGRHNPVLTDTPAWPAAAAFHTAMALHLPGWAHALAAYRTRTEKLIRPAPDAAYARTTLRHPSRVE